MQYSSVLISPKLWAELATYVRQLCKISEQGPCSKSDWKRAEGQWQENIEGELTGMNNRRNLITPASGFRLSYLGWTGRHSHIHCRWSVSSNYANIFLSCSSAPETPEDSSRSAREREAEKPDSRCRNTHISTSCPVSKWEHTHTECKYQYCAKHHLIPPPPCPHMGSKKPYTDKQTCTDLHTVALTPTHPSRSRPDGGLHRNRSFVTHDVPGQGMHYRWAQTACLSEHSPHSQTQEEAAGGGWELFRKGISGCCKVRWKPPLATFVSQKSRGGSGQANQDRTRTFYFKMFKRYTWNISLGI